MIDPRDPPPSHLEPKQRMMTGGGGAPSPLLRGLLQEVGSSSTSTQQQHQHQQE